MNFIKRAFLSVKERKIKTFVLIVIFLIISNLILAGYSIQTATKTASDLAIQKLGSDVTLTVDNAKLREKGTKRADMPSLTAEIANKLSGLNYVKAYNYISSSAAQANGFTPIKTESDTTTSDNGNNNNQSVKFGGQMGQMMNADISLTGVISTDLLDGFNNSTDKVISGRAITKTDLNSSVAMIEKNLATNNSLKVGDTIQIKSANGDKNLTLTIVGIYQNTSSQDTNVGVPMDFMNPSNLIYVPYTITSQLKTSSTAGTLIDQAIYYLDAPAHMDAFKALAAKTGVDLTTYKLDANETLYKQMMGPIENVASFAKIVVYIVAIAGAVILGLIVFLSIKERRQEMGILLSIGERKTKLIGQFLVETLMIAVLAFGLSIFTGNVLSQKIGDTLLQNEISATQQQQQDSPRNRMMRNGFPGQQQQADVKAVDHIDVSVTLGDVEKMAGMGFAIVIFSTLIPTLSVLRLRPKTILTKNE